MQLKPKDMLFVYTDGVPEASNTAGEFYGMERLETALNKDPKIGAQEMIANIREDVDRFVNSAKQFDDLTMLCIEYKGIEKG